MRTLPYTVTLARKDGSRPRTFIIRACTPDDLLQIMSLQEEVRQGIEDPSTFAFTTTAEISESLFLDRVFCAVEAGKIAGLTVMIVNRPSSRNAGSHIGYTEEEQKTCVTMEATFIAPYCRGYGLQQIFFALREEAALELGATEALTTISPFNKYSLHNATSSGFEVVAEKALYGGYARCILRKKFDRKALNVVFRKMRRPHEALSEEACIELLKEQPRGVMSMMGMEGYPYGVPLDHWYNEEDGKLYFHGGLIGHRVDAIHANDKVSYCVFDEGYRKEGEWALNIKSVICFGTVEIIDDPAEVEDICRKLSYKFTDDESHIQSEIEQGLARTLCMAMTIDHMSGKQVLEA